MSAGLLPEDPFAVDEARWLESLTADWGMLYFISVNGGHWYAALRDGSALALTADTPGKLAEAMQTDYTGWSRR